MRAIHDATPSDRIAYAVVAKDEVWTLTAYLGMVATLVEQQLAGLITTPRRFIEGSHRQGEQSKEHASSR